MTVSSAQPTRGEPIDIGEVISRSGVPASTLHVWEDKGLISPVARRGLRRQYDPEVLTRIAIIVICQRSQFSLAEIAEILCPNAFRDGKGLLVDKLDELKEQRAVLDQAISGIEHAIGCDHPAAIDCPGFQSHLEGVLPVDGSRRPATRPK